MTFASHRPGIIKSLTVFKFQVADVWRIRRAPAADSDLYEFESQALTRI